MKNSLFPIYLPERTAMNLVSKFAQAELNEHKRNSFTSRNSYEYHGKVLENGDVEVYVRYSFDDGYCMGCGTAFEKTIRPYDEAMLSEVKRQRMMQLAEMAYEAAEEVKRQKAITALAKKMFKNAPELGE